MAGRPGDVERVDFTAVDVTGNAAYADITTEFESGSASTVLRVVRRGGKWFVDVRRP